MNANEIKDFIYKNYYKRIGFSVEKNYCSLNALKKKYIVPREQINKKYT